jgi:hypothetical protein
MSIIQPSVNMSKTQAFVSKILQNMLIHEPAPPFTNMLRINTIIVNVPIALAWKQHESHKTNDFSLLLQEPHPIWMLIEQPGEPGQSSALPKSNEAHALQLDNTLHQSF